MKKDVYIFGAGYKGKELLEYLNCLYSQVNVRAYIDNDVNKQGTRIDNLDCISLEEAVKRDAQDDMILISPKNSDKMEQQLREYGFRNFFCTRDWIENRKKYFVPDSLNLSDFKWAHPFNDKYNSPYPDIMEVRKKESELFDRTKDCLDIDFNIDRQLELIENMSCLDLPEWTELNEKENKYRYYYRNSWFQRESAMALCYMMRIVKPHNIIEVGSGYSTAVMLDTNECYLENKVNIIAIEPNMKRLRERLKPTDKIEVYEKDFQDIPVDFFEILDENDILFIDSSHISKIGSDVNYLFFEILPRLKRGVHIHFHDVYYPFVYLKQWIYEGQAWNEQYILRAFLMNNSKYSIQLFGSLLMEKYRDKLPEHLKGCWVGSLWLKKCHE